MNTEPIPALSIVIPLYNEAGHFGKTCETITRFAALPWAPPFEVVFVDDGSRDATAELVRSFAARFPGIRLVSHPNNLGKGAAVKTGMLAARGARRLMADADMATDLAEFQKYLRFLGAGAPVLIGSRRIDGAEILVHQPRLREIMGGVYTVLANLFTGAGVSDFTCGFKCFSAHAAQAIFSRSKIARWSYDAEILFLARRLGYAIQEVPVVWRNDSATRVRLWKDAPRAFFDLCLLQMYAALGYYDVPPQTIKDSGFARTIRYIESGTAAAGVNFFILYILAEYFHVWYLVAATIAFSIAVVVSFLLQKYWTFRDSRSGGSAVAAQGASYLTIAVCNVFLNAIFVYVFVEKIGLWYFLAQAISAIIIALWSFAAYRFFVFR